VYEDFTQLARIVASPDAEDLVVRSQSLPETEMDMYENLWKFKDGHEKEEADAPQSKPGLLTSSQSASFSDVAEMQKPSVISVMTTTEMRTLPDGTVYTKRVLKRRFSDGTEESREEESTGQPESENKSEDFDGGHELQAKKGGAGWFWH